MEEGDISSQLTNLRIDHDKRLDEVLYGHWGRLRREGGLFSEKDGFCRKMDRSGLSGMTLRRFLSLYAGELEDYYEEYLTSIYKYMCISTESDDKLYESEYIILKSGKKIKKEL